MILNPRHTCTSYLAINFAQHVAIGQRCRVPVAAVVVSFGALLAVSSCRLALIALVTIHQVRLDACSCGGGHEKGAKDHKYAELRVKPDPIARFSRACRTGLTIPQLSGIDSTNEFCRCLLSQPSQCNLQALGEEAKMRRGTKARMTRFAYQ